MERITRDAFLYMDPKQPKDAFAQCATCGLYVGGTERCSILGPAVVVKAGDSCGLYAHGSPNPDLPIHGLVSPEEAGLVHRQVRCENCTYLTPAGCDLYWQINKKFPDLFDLNNDVDPQGCCNAQTPKGEEKAMNISGFADILGTMPKGEVQKAGARHGKEDLALVQKAHDAMADLVRGAQCAGMEKTKAAEELAKAGARHAKVDLDRIQKCHDMTVELGGKCAGS